jgi:hypothetical protein
MQTILNQSLEFFVAIILAVFSVIYSIFGYNSSDIEAFVPNIARSSINGYPSTNLPKIGNGKGGDDRFKMFHPYLRQTEYSSYEQRDNHKWPSSNELAGSMEQGLNLDPVLPCYFPKTKGKNIQASRF